MSCAGWRCSSGSLDGLRARAAGRDAILALAGADDQAELAAAADAWLAEQQASIDYPDPSGETWAADRLEYSFSVMAAAAEHVVLSADAYTGGHLDWEAFDVTSAAVAPPAPTTTRDVLPVPVTYAGTPASTHWQLEDGTVSFGDIQAGPTDLARLAVAEFAMVYSDDYFLVPIRLVAGSIARVTRLEVSTTFGESVTVRSAAEWDEAAGVSARGRSSSAAAIPVRRAASRRGSFSCERSRRRSTATRWSR